MENKFKEKWTLNEVDWHEHVPHHYHVSQIGVGHQDLSPDKHQGPCLRQAYYRIVVPKERDVGSEGNLFVGTTVHEKLQDITKKNVPHSIIEFPLFGKYLHVTYSGSVDIVKFKKKSFLPIKVNVCDIKSASEYTLPKYETDYNPTYFAQVYLYAYILNTFYLVDVFVQDLEIWYVNKHNYATHVITQKYDPKKGKEFFKDFLQRCTELDAHLQTEVLPDKEPMRWCKYCDYRMLCDSDCATEEGIKVYTEEEIENMYMKKTGKSPYWRGNKTKAYYSFKGGFKVEL